MNKYFTKNINLGIILVTIFIIGSCATADKASQKIELKTNYTENEVLEYKYYFFKGLEFKSKKEYASAVQCFYKCLSIDSLDYSSLRNLAIIHKDVKSYKAMNDFAHKAKLSAKLKEISTVEMSKLIIQYHQIHNNDEKVVELYESELKNEPNNVELKRDFVTFLTSIYRYERAFQLLDEIEKISENFEDKNGFVGKTRLKNYINKKELDLARNEIEKLIEQFPDSVDFKLLYADVYLAEGKVNKALDIYKDQAQAYENLNVLILTAHKMESIRDTLGAFNQYKKIINSKLIEQKEKVSAIQSSIFALDMTLIPTEKSIELVNLYLNQYDDYQYRFAFKEVLKRARKFDLCVQELKQLIKIDTSSADLYKELMFILSDMGKYDQMYEYSAKAYELDPHNPLVILIHGQKYLREKKHKKAIEIFEKGINFSLSNLNILFRIYVNLGDLYYTEKEHDKMFEYYQKALKINDKDALLLNNYSYYLAVLNKDLEKAREMSKKAVSLEPNNAIYIDTFAWVCFKQKKYDDALIMINRAIELHKKAADKEKQMNAELFEHKGDILYKLGKKKEAMKMWREAKQYEGYTDNLEKKIRTGIYVE